MTTLQRPKIFESFCCSLDLLEGNLARPHAVGLCCGSLSSVDANHCSLRSQLAPAQNSGRLLRRSATTCVWQLGQDRAACQAVNRARECFYNQCFVLGRVVPQVARDYARGSYVNSEGSRLPLLVFVDSHSQS